LNKKSYIGGNSRIQWIKEGDRNTKFFHQKATWRAKKNKIERLMRQDGSMTENKEEMEDMATKFFTDLYTADEHVQPDIITDYVQAQISREMNEKLCAVYSDEEIVMPSFKLDL
jgi:hypothetical protein